MLVTSLVALGFVLAAPVSAPDPAVVVFLPLGAPVGIWSLVLATALFVGVIYVTEPPTARARIFIDDVDAGLHRYRIR
ncbi:hypothetical protein [Aquisalimonas sp.]|uniref:hypothetical protein n=1 Tax=Aquisalimonas sp. TaxID=1872621 RepID=UPI0025C3E432|nr:hypothetical protein [Aquisalimonas sp.]